VERKGVKWGAKEWGTKEKRRLIATKDTLGLCSGQASVREGKPKARADGLADGAANYGCRTARDADADEQDDEQYGAGSDCGARQEVDKDVIEAHRRQYRAREGFERGY